MPISKIKITNFKCFKDTFEIKFEDELNILVGKNGEGKSTILEAINLALTGYYQGRAVSRELSQYLFNKIAVKEYIDAIRQGNMDVPCPEIAIEVFYKDANGNPEFEGNRNSEKLSGVCGFTFFVKFDDKYQDVYDKILEDNRESISSIPLEYYEVGWETFSRKFITPREIKLNSSLVDSSRNSYRSISDVYVSRIIKNSVAADDRVALAQEYRKLASSFALAEAVRRINAKLNSEDAPFITGEKLSISVDVGSNSSWESSLIALADDVPFSNIGKGTQCILKTELSLLSKEHERAGVVLIEEPECHLSHTNLTKLVAHIEKQSQGKQIIISTHSSYVTNRLGLDKVILISKGGNRRLSDLNSETANYFRKLSSYDTLRFVLCEQAILVEGPCDALVVERAYKDKWGKYPSEDGIDILEVGLSFSRFLELAVPLQINTTVVTDNDGRTEALKEKYAAFEVVPNIKICYESESVSLPKEWESVLGRSYNNNTLEPTLFRSNGLAAMKTVLGVDMKDEPSLLKYMKEHKTDCALIISESEKNISYPDYIKRAIGDE